MPATVHLRALREREIMKFRSRRGGILARSVLAALAASPAASFAATRTWIGGSGYWDVATNWSPKSLPAAGDDALLTSSDGLSRTITYHNAANPALNSLKIDATSGGSIGLAIGQDALTAANQYVGYSGTGWVNQTAGSNTA